MENNTLLIMEEIIWILQNSIEITKSNEVIIAGYSLSANNIATTGAYQTTISIQDAFIAKFDNQGNIIWATYFGRQ